MGLDIQPLPMKTGKKAKKTSRNRFQCRSISLPGPAAILAHL
jgi:hypothetical protein